MRNHLKCYFANRLFLSIILPSLALSLAPCMALSATPNGSSPAQVVQGLNEALLGSMRAGSKAGFDGRSKLLQGEVQSAFDFSVIGSMVLGADWAQLSKEQRSTFVETLKRYTIANYASQFNRYSGERFTKPKASPYRKDIDIVQSQLVGPKAKHHSFIYVVQHNAGGWKIINVVVDGVSNLSVMRAQYQSVLETHGFSALIKKIHEKIAKLSH